MKWVFYVLVFVYMCYRAVYGAKVPSISVEQIDYGENGFLEVGTRKTINCKASSKNQMLEWIDPFGKTVMRIPSRRVFAQEQFVSSPKGGRSPGLALTITDLLVGDSGVYKCVYGTQVKNVPLCVIKPSEFVDTPTEVTIEKGRAITLTCQVNGEPEPRVVWNVRGEEVVEGAEHSRYRVNRKYNSQGYESLLTITSVVPEDEGVYSCVSVQESPMLDNCTHTNSFNVTLRVNHSPLFKNGNDTKYVYGKTNEVVELQCAASGWPKPTYRWFKDLGGNTLYEFDKTKITFTESPHTAVLPITAGLSTFGQVYKCKATNSFGEADKNFKLLKIEKPRRASEVENVLTTANALYFNVSWYDDVYFPIESFDVQYFEVTSEAKRPKESQWKKASQIKIEVDQDHVDDEDPGLVVEIANLEPETEYFVRLRATNEAGEAPWSDTVRASTIAVVENENSSEETVNETEEPVEESVESAEPEAESGIDTNSGMFYGIFFAGAIAITVVVCMFFMRIV